MMTNIQTIEETIATFNEEQYWNVSHSIIIDVDVSMKSLHILILTTEGCNDCAADIKAMCLSSGDYSGKEWVDGGYEMRNGIFSHKRKYCDFDSTTTEITWTFDNSDDRNTTYIQPNPDDSLTLKCRDGFILFHECIYNVMVINVITMMGMFKCSMSYNNIITHRQTLSSVITTTKF